MNFLIRHGFSLLALAVGLAQAAPVPLQNSTASYSQPSANPTGLWDPWKTIDGVTDGSFTSWAIFDPAGIQAQTIVWETQQDVGTGSETFRFDLYHGDYVPASTHYLGHFRLSYTTDNRSVFADGLANGGAVNANWNVVAPITALSTGGDTLALQGDGSILVTQLVSTAATHPTYQVTAQLAAVGITGFRLEALKDPSLPLGGPGLEPTAGNFHLSEFVVSTVPEPASSALLAAGLLAVLILGRRRG